MPTGATPGAPGRLWREWLFCVLAVLAFAMSAQWAGVFERADFSLYDGLLRRSAQPAHPDIVIVAVDEPSLRQLGRWPWPREMHARVLERLAVADPRAVALDLLLVEPSTSEADDAVAHALANLRKVTPVFLPLTVQTPLVRGQVAQPLRPLPLLEQAVTGLGHINVELDADGVVRSLYLREGPADSLWPAMPLALASAGGAKTPAVRPGAAVDEGFGWLREARVLVPFSGPPGHYKVLPYASVLHGEVPDAALRDKIVLVGLTGIGIGDHYPTPFSGGSGLMPGVEINAAALDGMLRGALIAPTSALAQALAAGVALFLFLLWLWSSGPRGGLFGLLAFALLSLMTTAVLQLVFRVWMPVGVWLVSSVLGYLLWSWRRLAVLLQDLYFRTETLRSGAGANPSPTRHAGHGWQHVVEALDRGLQAEKQAQRQRNEALQLLSHDLRAPQSAILALLGTSDPRDDKAVQLTHERIERQVRTTLSLADDFVVQLRAEESLYDWQEVDLAQLLSEVYERAWPLAQGKSVKLALQLPQRPSDKEDAGFWIDVEPRLLGRALFNLVENAIKYSAPGTQTSIGLSWIADVSVEITVRDQGRGIAASDLPRLFERYARFGAEGETQGHGLGLTLVKTVVERHHGTIQCHSEPGIGTVFTVLLPLGRRVSGPAAPSAA